MPFLSKKKPAKFLNKKVTSNIRQNEYKIMSVENLMEASEDFFTLEQIGAGIETDNTLIFEEITRELEAYLSKENENANSTDGVFNFLLSLVDQAQVEF